MQMKALADLDWVEEPLAIDFANTVRRDGWDYYDLLGTGEAVAEWTRLQRGRVPAVAAPAAGRRIEEIRALRDDVFAALKARALGERDDVGRVPAGAAIERINAHLRAVPVVLQVAHDDAEALWVPSRLSRVDNLLARVGADTAALFLNPAVELGFCDAPSCGGIFTRERPNQRWCGSACGTRARVARHADRYRGPGSHSSETGR